MTTPATIDQKFGPVALEAYREDFEAFEGNGAGTSPSWLKELRRRGIEHFVRLGFPTNKHEDWRFTNVLPLTKIRFSHAELVGSGLLDASKAEACRFGIGSLLVFVDGHFSEPLSRLREIPGGVIAGSLAREIDRRETTIAEFLNRHVGIDRSTFAALNTAFIRDGAFLRIPPGVNVPEPVEILHLSTGGTEGQKLASYPRSVIIAEEGASVTVVETYRASGGRTYFTNAVTELFLAEGARVDYLKVQEESHDAFHIGTLQAYQSRHSRLTAFSLALGSAIARNDFNIDVDGDEAETMLDGLYVTSGRQLIDHHTSIDHRRPSCSSREIFRGIVSAESRAVFNGKIFVRREAQKTDSKQTNKNLLLSDKATVDTKPQLEIFADDVKCTHGATVGGLDESSLFYAKSRGLGEEAARGLLTVGFASDVTKLIGNPELRRRVDALVVDALQKTVVQIDLPEIVH